MDKEGKKLVPFDEAREQIERVCRRLAMLHVSYARTLVEEFGEEEGKRLAVKAIKDYGKRIGKDALKRTLAKGLDNSPDNYSEDLPAYGLYEELERLETGHGQTIRLKGCAMGKTWKEMGEEELGRIYCYVDPAKSMSFNPDWALVHSRCMPDGDEFCDLHYRKTSEKEKEEFLEKETDLGKIDRI